MIGLNFRGLPGPEFRGRLRLVDHQDPDAGKDIIGMEVVSLVWSLGGVETQAMGSLMDMCMKAGRWYSGVPEIQAGECGLHCSPLRTM